MDYADLIAQIIGREESRQKTSEYYEIPNQAQARIDLHRQVEYFQGALAGQRQRRTRPHLQECNTEIVLTEFQVEYHIAMRGREVRGEAFQRCEGQLALEVPARLHHAPSIDNFWQGLGHGARDGMCRTAQSQ